MELTAVRRTDEAALEPALVGVHLPCARRPALRLVGPEDEPSLRVDRRGAADEGIAAAYEGGRDGDEGGDADGAVAGGVDGHDLGRAVGERKL